MWNNNVPQQRSLSYAGFVPPSANQTPSTSTSTGGQRPEVCSLLSSTFSSPKTSTDESGSNTSGALNLAQLIMSLFTVEQLDLIRRLRATGITADGVVHAFNSLDQLERDLRSVNNVAESNDAPSTSLCSPPTTDASDAIQLPLLNQSSSSAENGDTSTATTNTTTPLAESDGCMPLTNAESLSSLSGRLDSTNINVQLARAAASWRAAQVQAANAATAIRPQPTVENPLALHLARLNSNALAEANLLDSLQRQAREKAPVSVTVTGAPSRPPLLLQQQPSTAMHQTPLRRQSFSALTSNYQQKRDLMQARLNAVNNMALNGGGSPEQLPNAGYVPDQLRSQGGGRIHANNRQQPKPDIQEFVTLQDPTELEQLLKNGEEAAISEMKQFIQQYQLRQTTVGSMTNISQPYVSKFLNGNYKDLSLRCRTKIFVWYLNCRRNPEKMARFIADPYHATNRTAPNDSSHSDPNMRARAQSLSEAAHLSSQLRPIMQRVLERHYQENPTPDLQKRIEIANECNRLVCEERRSVGSPALVARELITHAVVAVWFMNRRKHQGLAVPMPTLGSGSLEPALRKLSANPDVSMMRMTSSGTINSLVSSRGGDSALSSRSPYTDDNLSVTQASSNDSLSMPHPLVANSAESSLELNDMMPSSSNSFSSSGAGSSMGGVDQSFNMLRARRAYSESLPRRYGNLSIHDQAQRLNGMAVPATLALGTKRRSPGEGTDGQDTEQSHKPMADDNRIDEDDATPPARMSDTSIMQAIKMETDDISDDDGEVQQVKT